MLHIFLRNRFPPCGLGTLYIPVEVPVIIRTNLGPASLLEVGDEDRLVQICAVGDSHLVQDHHSV